MTVQDAFGSEPYTLRPKPPLFSGISDLHLSLICPIAVHWLTSAGFEICDRFGWMSQYRLHTTAEELARNRVTRLKCFLVTLQCQGLQMLLGIILGAFGEGDMTGSEKHDEAIWIHRVRAAMEGFVILLSLTGIDFPALQATLWRFMPFLSTPGHAQLDVLIGSFVYWYIVPAFQFIFALITADACMYFIHRLGHTNKWIYKHIHSTHHRLYVPYSWGGSYNHPMDSLFLDGISYAIGCWASGISIRLSIFLFGYATFKNVLDHCGYVFPWNPIRSITGTDTSFHDVHHQSWGLKTNFGAHLSIWDRLMGTYFDDEALISRLRVKNRIAAENMMSRLS